MKKSAVLLGGVCVAALIAGGAYMFYNNSMGGLSGKEIAAYWDKTTDVNQKAQDGSLPLIKAAMAEDVAAVEYFLKKGAKANVADKDGQTALTAAMEKGNYAIFKLLIEAQPTDLKAPKFLDKAVIGNSAEIVKYVLDNGGDANAKLEIIGKYRPDENLTYEHVRLITPLKRAVMKSSDKVIPVLLEHGAEGAEYFLQQELSKAPVAVLKALATKTDNLRRLSAKGSDLLTTAVMEAKPETLEFLLEENAGDVNSALNKLLFYRNSEGNDYDKAAEMFIKAGIVPTADELELLLKKGKTELFKELAACALNANMTLPKNKQSLLRFAVDNNKISEAKYLLENGADMWAEDKDGVSALFAAVKQAESNSELYQEFKKRLKDVNEDGYKGESLLMLLAKAGQFKEFQKVAEEGGDIWQKDRNGKTVLMYAAEGGNVQIINHLIYKGDNFGATDNNGKTALMYAAEAGKTNAYKELVTKGASVKGADKDGKSALMYAAGNGHADIVEDLISQGESPVAFDNNRKTVLMYAVESGDMDTVKAVTSKSVEADAVDKDGMPVLSYAVLGKNLEIVKFIVGQKVDIFAQNKYGYQPFTLAMKEGLGDIALFLAGNRADIFKPFTTDNGRTLSMYAVDGGNPDLMRWVTDNLPDLYNKKDRNGQTFMMLMAEKGRADVVRDVILRRGNISARDGKGKSVLMYAAESEAAINLINIVKEIPEFEINVKDNLGKTALMYAVGGPYNQTIKQQRLIQHSAKVEDKDNNGKTVLMYAVGNPYARVDAPAVAELLGYDVNVNATDNNGANALMYAAANPNAGTAVIEILLDKKADINAKDTQGKTVLMYAAESGDISKFKLLMQKGAKTDGTTADGKTVADFADKVGPCFAAAVRQLIQK